MKKCLLVVLAGGLAGCVLTPQAPTAASAAADVASPRTDCVTASDAQERRRQVEHGLLPNVVFVGEVQPASVESRMLAHRVPAFSVAVIRNGQLDWTAAWGSLGQDGDQADCDSLFQAGSLAKPVTVLAALRMAQQGRIDLDADIESYLERYRLPPGKQTAAHPVTLRNLFMHTAGITPGGYEGYVQGAAIPNDVQTVRGEAPSNARKVEVLEQPDAALVYSGGGYTVAEIALEDVFDQPFERLLHDWLLAPVGMNGADFTVPLPPERQGQVARGHHADAEPVAGGWHNHPEQAAAGLWANAIDLARLLVELRRAHRGESAVIAQDSIRELLGRPFDGHAYGFRLIGEGDGVFLTHNGGTVGYRASMTVNLVTGDGAVFLANSDAGMELGREFLSAVARVYQWPVFREVQVKRMAQPTDLLKSLTGQYEFPEQGWKISVTFEAGALVLVFPNGDRYVMTPIQGGALEFIHAATGVRASFAGTPAQREIQLYGQTGRRREDGR